MTVSSPLVVAIIQARMASSRLPGKVLLDIAGEPMLGRVARRTQRARLVHQVLIATTTDPGDDAIQAYCERSGFGCFRGNQHDVLDRYYQAALAAHAGVVVRITADCPVIDPALIDQSVLALYGLNGPAAGLPPEVALPAEPRFDFVANRLPPPWGRTFPIGLDTEVCTFAALQRAWREARLPHQREHVMPYLYEPGNSVHVTSLIDVPASAPADAPPGAFRVLRLDHDPDYGDMRWTVDTAEDLALLRRIYAHFGGRDDFAWLDVLCLVQEHPELSEINADVTHKSVHDVDQRFTR